MTDSDIVSLASLIVCWGAACLSIYLHTRFRPEGFNGWAYCAAFQFLMGVTRIPSLLN